MASHDQSPNTGANNQIVLPGSNGNYRNENILCAVLALLKELDDSGLELVKRDIERKLHNHRKQAAQPAR